MTARPTLADQALSPGNKPSRAEVNRANAQHSTGPNTAAGKANSRRNSFKHGLYSQQLVTSAEDAGELDALKADLRAEHQPINQTEEILVNEMAEQFWRIRRARRYEAQLLDGDTLVFSHLAAVQRMMSSAERGFHKALATLRQLQKEAKTQAKDQTTATQPGFVPHETPSVAHSSELSPDDDPGFVPPPCPPDVDPSDWARAFRLRHEVWKQIPA
jgi:hypothetical protein